MKTPTQVHILTADRRDKKTEKVGFGDVVGCDEAKDEIKQVAILIEDQRTVELYYSVVMDGGKIKTAI